MSRTRTPLRALMIVGTLSITAVLVPQARAADPAPQRVAMACTQSDAGCKPAVRVVAAAERSNGHATKAPAQPKPESRQVAAQTNDGSRFLYDSCGCSND